MKWFFIHKFIDGSVVKFTKVPQVKHEPLETMYDVKKYPYVRTLRGRIAKVISAEQREIDTSKYNNTVRLEKKWFFSVIYLDNLYLDYIDKTDIQASIYLQSVNIKWYNLLCYKIYRYLKVNGI